MSGGSRGKSGLTRYGFTQCLMCWVFPPQQDNSHECYDLGLGISFGLMVNATDYHARNAGSIPAYCRIFCEKQIVTSQYKSITMRSCIIPTYGHGRPKIFSYGEENNTTPEPVDYFSFRQNSKPKILHSFRYVLD